MAIITDWPNVKVVSPKRSILRFRKDFLEEQDKEAEQPETQHRSGNADQG
jgi:hypothetical protein